MGRAKYVRGAGGGGSKSQRQPIEAPDSLRSIQYARILDLVSEGEIFGFADQANPLSCVYLNETPVANEDGTLNFKNIQIDSRVGTQTQDYIRGFDGVENEISINTELRSDTPWTRSITNLDLSGVRVTISVPAFSKADTGNGDINGYSVAYRIEVATDGGAFSSVFQSAFTGKATSKYARSHRIDLPFAEEGWLVRVVRITPNETSATIQDKTMIDSFAEIIDAKLRYPMSALVGMVVDAEQFSNIPSRAYDLCGRIIRVPSNYDPVARTYTGLWDGTFQSRYSNNPAWVFYDAATNTRYGLGNRVNADQMDKWALYKIGVYCDGMVDDGFGNLEPRFTSNVYLQSQNDATKVMQDLATVFRGIMYAAGGAVVAGGDMPDTPMYTYNQSNVIEGKFIYGGSGKRVRHTVALVSWNDMSDFGRAKVEYVDDKDGLARYGYQPTEVIAVGCTSRGQARRLGKYVLATERFETDSVTFSVGLDGTFPAPGKIIAIADELRAGKRIAGRVRAASADTITLDRLPDPITIGDELSVVLPDGTLQKRDVSALLSGNRVQVSPAYSAEPTPQSVWMVETDGLKAQLFKVISIVDGNDGTVYNINATQHVAGKYAFVEEGILIEEPPISQIPGPFVPSPTNLTISHRDVADENTTQKVVTLSWDTVFQATTYNVMWRQGQGNWIDLGRCPAACIDIYGVVPGPFEVQVVAINANGVESAPAFGGPFDITPVGTPPGYVPNIHARIDEEELERINAILAEATARTAAIAAEAAARAAAILDAKLEVEASIDNEALIRQTEDESLANAISALSAGSGEQFDSQKVWYFDLTVEAWTGNGTPTVANGFLRPADAASDPWVQSPTGVAVDGSKYKYVKARIKRTGSPVWEGKLEAYDASNALISTLTIDEPLFDAGGIATADFKDVAWTGTIDHIRLTVGEAQTATDYYEFDWIAIGRPAPGASTAALQQEALARVTADLAEATERTTLAAQMRGNYTGTDVTHPDLVAGLVFSERQVRIAADSAIAEDVTALEVRMDDAETGISANAGAVSVLSSRITAAEGVNTVQSGQITQVTAGLNQMLNTNPNIIPNPTWETDTVGWTTSGTGGAWSRQTPDGNGPYSMFTATGTGNDRRVYTEINGVIGSNDYTFAADLLKNGGGSFFLKVEFYDAGGTLLSSSLDQPVTVTGSWQRVNIVRPAPVSATKARLIIAATSTTANCFARRAKFEKSSVMSPYTAEQYISGFASAITSLDARVTTNSGNITAQASQITSLTSSIAGKADVTAVTALTTRVSNEEQNSGTGANLLVNSLFQVNDKGWIYSGSIPGTHVRDQHGTAWQPSNSHSVVLSLTPPGVAGSDYYSMGQNGIPIVPGKKYCLSAWVATHRCNVGMNIVFLDQAGTPLVHAFAIEAPGGGGGPDLNTDYVRKFAIGVAPLNARFANILIFQRSVGDGTAPWLWVIRPMMEQVKDTQQFPSAYNSGGPEMFAAYTLTLDVNGYVSGFQANNDGSTANFAIRADNFSIVAPGGGARTEYSGGNWRVYDGAGVLRVRMGIW